MHKFFLRININLSGREISMQRKIIRLIGSFLAIGFMVASVSFMPACSATTTKWISTTADVALEMITIEPLYPGNIAVGSTLQFEAIGNYPGGETRDITSQVTWVSDNTKAATISPAGLATGVADGTVKITAIMTGRISPSVTLVVGTPVTTSTTGSTAAP
jgi:hypothetical protein